jgi:hypothetical protein
MTLTRCAIHTIIFATAITWGSITTLAQTLPPSHEHGSSSTDAVPDAVPDGRTGMSRVASLDARIAMLIADVNMFAGELKIQAMAELLKVLVERQLLVDAEMRRMHQEMHGPMNGPRRHAPPAAPPSDVPPEEMCSPYV